MFISSQSNFSSQNHSFYYNKELKFNPLFSFEPERKTAVSLNILDQTVQKIWDCCSQLKLYVNQSVNTKNVRKNSEISRKNRSKKFCSIKALQAVMGSLALVTIAKTTWIGEKTFFGADFMKGGACLLSASLLSMDQLTYALCLMPTMNWVSGIQFPVQP